MDVNKVYQLHELLRDRHSALSMCVIAEQMQCSQRTAKRIIKFMRDQLNAPLSFDRDYGGYRYTDERYELPGLWFSAEEILALLSLQRLMAELGSGILDQQLSTLKPRIEKMLAAKHMGQGETHRIRLLPMAARLPDSAMFQTIAGALLQRRQLEIRYHARSDNAQSTRIISPQRLVYYRDNWYLDAWCHNKNALRNFSLDRIRAAKMLNTPAENIEDASLDAHFAEGYGIFAGTAQNMATLHFTPQRARWVADERWHPKQQSQWLADGSYQLQIPYADSRELLMDIMRHLPEVKIIAPEALRLELTQRLQAALEQHSPI